MPVLTSHESRPTSTALDESRPPVAGLEEQRLEAREEGLLGLQAVDALRKVGLAAQGPHGQKGEWALGVSAVLTARTRTAQPEGNRSGTRRAGAAWTAPGPVAPGALNTGRGLHEVEKRVLDVQHLRKPIARGPAGTACEAAAAQPSTGQRVRAILGPVPSVAACALRRVLDCAGPSAGAGSSASTGALEVAAFAARGRPRRPDASCGCCSALGPRGGSPAKRRDQAACYNCS